MTATATETTVQAKKEFNRVINPIKKKRSKKRQKFSYYVLISESGKSLQIDFKTETLLNQFLKVKQQERAAKINDLLGKVPNNLHRKNYYDIIKFHKERQAAILENFGPLHVQIITIKI